MLEAIVVILFLVLAIPLTIILSNFLSSLQEATIREGLKGVLHRPPTEEEVAKTQLEINRESLASTFYRPF